MSEGHAMYDQPSNLYLNNNMQDLTAEKQDRKILNMWTWKCIKAKLQNATFSTQPLSYSESSGWY